MNFVNLNLSQDLAGQKSSRYKGVVDLEVLITPTLKALYQSLQYILVEPFPYKLIVHAGPVFKGSGGWICTDGVFTFSDFLQLYEKQRTTWESGDVTVDSFVTLSCIEEGPWSNASLKQHGLSPSEISLVRTVPPGDGGCDAPEFLKFISNYVRFTELSSLMEPSSITGSIPYGVPTLYIFPSGQGNAALFGVDQVCLLLDGGFQRKSCFWDFLRYVKRIDWWLISSFGMDNLLGVSSFLSRLQEGEQCPKLAYVFANVPEHRNKRAKGGGSPTAEAPSPLVLSQVNEVNRITEGVAKLGLKPHPCYLSATGRKIEPISLYEKMGCGKLELYILHPAPKDGATAATVAKSAITMPTSHDQAIAFLLVWKPFEPSAKPVRILYPGSCGVEKVLSGLDKLKSLDVLHVHLTLRASISQNVRTVAKQQWPDSTANGRTLASYNSADTTSAMSSKVPLPNDVNRSADAPLEQKHTFPAGTEKTVAQPLAPTVPVMADENSAVVTTETNVKKRPIQADASGTSVVISAEKVSFQADEATAASPVSLNPKQANISVSDKVHSVGEAISRVEIESAQLVDKSDLPVAPVTAGSLVKGEPFQALNDGLDVDGKTTTYAKQDWPSFDYTADERNVPWSENTVPEASAYYDALVFGSKPVEQAEDLPASATVGHCEPLSPALNSVDTVDGSKQIPAAAPAADRAAFDVSATAFDPFGSKQLPSPMKECAVEVKVEMNGPPCASQCTAQLPELGEGAEATPTKRCSVSKHVVSSSDGCSRRKAKEMTNEKTPKSRHRSESSSLTGGFALNPDAEPFIPHQSLSKPAFRAVPVPAGSIPPVNVWDFNENVTPGGGSLIRPASVPITSAVSQLTTAGKPQQQTPQTRRLGSTPQSLRQKFEELKKDWGEPLGRPSPVSAGATKVSARRAAAATATATTTKALVKNGIDSKTTTNASQVRSEAKHSDFKSPAAKVGSGAAKQATGSVGDLIKPTARTVASKTAALKPSASGKTASAAADGSSAKTATKTTTMGRPPASIHATGVALAKRRVESGAGARVEKDKEKDKLSTGANKTGSSTSVSLTRRIGVSTGLAGRTGGSLKKRPAVITPYYVDLAYVPSDCLNGNGSLEFFRMVRAPYYVISSVQPVKEVVQALVQAKKEWEPSFDVLILPTYDSESLSLWLALNRDELQAAGIDFAPPAYRCMINLEDQEGCIASAFRVQF